MSDAEWSAVWISLKVAVTATAWTALPGIACGWLLARKRFPGKILVETLAYAPLVLPPVVTGYLLLEVFGRAGVLGRWVGAWAPLAFTWRGAALAAGVVAFPLLARAVRAGVELVDRDLEEAAALLGARPLRVLLTVTLPLAAPGILAGLFLAFARALGEFGATITFAGNILGETRTIPSAIYAEMQTPGGEASARRLALVSIVLAVAAVAASEGVARRLKRGAGGRA